MFIYKNMVIIVVAVFFSVHVEQSSNKVNNTDVLIPEGKLMMIVKTCGPRRLSYIFFLTVLS